jgi:hypothetical protein
MENAMNAFEILFGLVLVRLVLPGGLLLLIGDWIQRRQRAGFYR